MRSKPARTEEEGSSLFIFCFTCSFFWSTCYSISGTEPACWCFLQSACAYIDQSDRCRREKSIASLLRRYDHHQCSQHKRDQQVETPSQCIRLRYSASYLEKCFTQHSRCKKPLFCVFPSKTASATFASQNSSILARYSNTLAPSAIPLSRKRYRHSKSQSSRDLGTLPVALPGHQKYPIQNTSTDPSVPRRLRCFSACSPC